MKAILVGGPAHGEIKSYKDAQDIDSLEMARKGQWLKYVNSDTINSKGEVVFTYSREKS